MAARHSARAASVELLLLALPRSLFRKIVPLFSQSYPFSFAYAILAGFKASDANIDVWMLLTLNRTGHNIPPYPSRRSTYLCLAYLHKYLWACQTKLTGSSEAARDAPPYRDFSRRVHNQHDALSQQISLGVGVHGRPQAYRLPVLTYRG